MKPLSRIIGRASGTRLRAVQQTEMAECGLACVAMIANHHGYGADLRELRERFAVSNRGMSLAHLISVCQDSQLVVRALRVELAGLETIQLPAILHWNGAHFVVLESVNSGWGHTSYTIVDPATGRQTLSQKVFSELFTGVLLEVSPGLHFSTAPAPARFRLRQLWSGVKNLSVPATQVVILSLLFQIGALIAPLYLQMLIDTVQADFDVGVLMPVALGFVVLAGLAAGIMLARSVIIAEVSNSFAFQIASSLFRHMMSLPATWFSRRQVADTASRFESVNPVSDFITKNCISSTLDGGLALLSILIIALYSVPLALSAGAFALLQIACRAFIAPRQRLATDEMVKAAARQNGSVFETVRGINTIKMYGLESTRMFSWVELKGREISAKVRGEILSAKLDAALFFITQLDRIAFITLAYVFSSGDRLAIGVLAALIFYKENLSAAITSLGKTFSDFRMLGAHLERLADISLERSEPGEMSVKLVDDFTELSVEQVSFRYSDYESYLLSDLAITVSKGESVAIVGPSGGGKTTFIKLITGALNPTTGSIKVNGRLLSDYGPRRFRQKIGIVSQDDTLYEGTIGENICLFDSEPDFARVEEVCRIACIWDDIQKMPMGLGSLVGDMGASLSGGQRQRIFLARALYRSPALLIMDEGTAHLDAALETRITEALSSLGIASVLIAHRRAAIQYVDRVYSLINGKLEEVDKEEAMA
nr:peptidase domain-containing ABC transporter [Sphingomonas psychrotolerans]